MTVTMILVGVAGLVLGAMVGVLVAALLFIAGRSEDEIEKGLPLVNKETLQ
jgi:hypothetical protein